MPDKPVDQAIDEMKAGLAALSGVSGMEPVLSQAVRLLEVLADRFVHPYGPLIVAVCGPTGAGKSHLVNYLAGGPVSPSSYRRPSTAAPVLAALKGGLAAIGDESFLPGYERVEAQGEIVFDADQPGRRLYLVRAPAPAWDWPEDLALIDTPDFDSVRTENQALALDMARRADAVILAAHQAKYADQSTWDFLTEEAPRNRPLLVILNRVTATAAVDDFKRRVEQAGLKAPVLPWPEETAVGQVSVIAARKELTGWLEDLGRRSREVVAENGRRTVDELGRLLRLEVDLPLKHRLEDLEAALAGVRRITAQWMEKPMDRVSLNLPGETRESLAKNLGEMVRRSDLWAKPRRLLARPLAAAGAALKKLLGQNEAGTGTERQLADNLAEASREALVAAVRAEARELAAVLPLSAQTGPDLTPDEIRGMHQAMTERLNEWLKKEMADLLSGLPLGQKAAFYLVQFMHAGLVAGLWLQTGGLPGTEVLVGGALGPVISKLTGVVISNDSLYAFEKKAAEQHRRELAAVFQTQGRRYEELLEGEKRLLFVGGTLVPLLDAIEKEAARVWG